MNRIVLYVAECLCSLLAWPQYLNELQALFNSLPWVWNYSDDPQSSATVLKSQQVARWQFTFFVTETQIINLIFYNIDWLQPTVMFLPAMYSIKYPHIPVWLFYASCSYILSEVYSILYCRALKMLCNNAIWCILWMSVLFQLWSSVG